MKDIIDYFLSFFISDKQNSHYTTEEERVYEEKRKKLCT